MSNPPRRPPGPPPARPPPIESDKNVRLSIDPKRPPGPPPNAPPINTIKPPPTAPPPRNLTQNYQRPGVDSSVGKRSADEKPAQPSTDASPKPMTTTTTVQHKAGAISMFEEADEKVEHADKKGKFDPSAKLGPPRGPRPLAPSADPTAPMVRMPRALPPRSNPPGIPEGQPLPPASKPEKEARAPPPVRPPPKNAAGNRAPPKEDPKELFQQGKAVPPPDSEPPLLRVKKKRVEAVVKRREKDMPEFESSDEDEEDPDFVKQPLPFGVLKQPIPVSSLAPVSKKPPPPAATGVVEDRKDSKSSIKPVDDDSHGPRSIDHDHTPSNTLKDNKLSAFVPPAPAAHIDKHFDDSVLGKTLTRGRLSIKCIEGYDIRRKDDQDKVPRNDPFIKFRLGVMERHPWKTTETRRKQNGTPNFENEVVFFDVVDPLQYIFQEDLQICIELWNKSLTRNDLVGSVTMSVVRFFKKPFVSYTEKVPVYYPGMTRTLMKLQLEFVFEEARSGLAQITLYEAKGLRSIDPMGRQDPYVQLSLGKHYKKRSKSVKGGGVSPYFNEEDMLLWLDQENWVDDLEVALLDEDAKEDKPIGSTHFSLLPYMKMVADEAKEDSFDLFYYVSLDPKDDSEKKEVACGEIVMRIRFLPSGRLTVFMDRAKDLQFPEIHKPAAGEVLRLDPYVNLTLEGKAVKMIKRTAADKDGGHDPVWESSVAFDVVDQYLLDLEVLNQNIHGKDVPLGGTQLSLLNVFRNGSMEFWTSLKQKKANGGIKEVGAIFVRLTFTGPIGVSFPQFRPEVDSFDDTLRKLPTEQLAIKDAEVPLESRPLISTVPAEDDVPLAEAARQAAAKQEQMRSEGGAPEFTDEEIIAAFKFIDLDHNNFVGAAEIRHILVCMGEMITDEEIDMMISMVDLDGDGQVSYKEFRSLVLHPNPGVVDMHKEINADKDEELMREKQAMVGKSQGLDLTAFQRQKEMTLREQKKKMIISFVADNEVNFEYIKQSYLEYLELPKERRNNGRVKFSEFCKVMRIEPITEYKHLHAFYDSEELGDMDLREFLLSMLNFVEVDKDARIRFSFAMFDETKSGYISQREVEEILRGNHMISLASVQRKAETIMKQANSTTTGAITINEFSVVSKKFPNILFPSVGYTPATKHAPAAVLA